MSGNELSFEENSLDDESNSFNNNKSPEELSSNIDTTKNISKGEVYQLIRQFNLGYNNNETENLLEEIGINKQETIVLENLIERSKEKRKNSKFIEFYDKILNMFITPYEKIIQILNEVKTKLSDIKEERMAKDVQWVIKRINNDDIYNLNVDQIKLHTNTNLLNKSDNLELENTFQFLKEYSSDAFSKHKKEDISAVRRISNERFAIFNNENVNTRSIPASIARKSMINNLNVASFLYSPEVMKSNTAKQSVLYTVPTGKFILTRNNSMTKQDLRKSEQMPIKEEDDDYNTNNKNSELLVVDINKEESNKDFTSLNKRNSKFVSNFNEQNEENDLIKSSLLNNENSIIKLKEIPISNDILLEEGDDNNNNTSFDEENNDLRATILNNEKIQIDSPDFNVFDYSANFGRENVLINISDHIFRKYPIYNLIDQRRFETFIDKIRLGYDYLLPYHNDLHASDVLQTCYVFTHVSDLKNNLDLTVLDLAGFFIAAIVHDYKHPGLNNMYHINKKTSFAIKYNDISVLENYHVSSAFKVISHPNSNIFSNLHKEEYRIVRKRIVECVLATDMAKHTKSQSSLKMQIEQVRNKKNKEDNSVVKGLVNLTSEDSKFDRQQEVLNFLIHCSDISNQTKSFELCKQWTNLVTEEFFNQGDMEKNEKLPVSFLCDRNTTNIPKSQVGFITNIVLPCFKVLTQLLPSCDFLLKNLYTNLECWKKEDEANTLNLDNLQLLEQ